MEPNVQASAISVLANLPMVFYWKLNKIIEAKKLDVFWNIYWQMIIQSVILAILTIAIDGTKFDMSDTGVFGFLRAENAFFNICIFSMFGGFWAVCGYIWSLLYFSPLIVMNCLLIEPFAGQIVGVLMDIDEIPGALTWIGVVLIFIAINLLSRAKDKEADTDNAQDETPAINKTVDRKETEEKDQEI